MKEPTLRARRETPEVILDAARRRYVRFGPRKTTMSEVAREAGCSRATLYAHFPSKDALYTGLLEAETRCFLVEVDQVAASDASAPHKLAKILEATARIYATSPVLYGAIAGDEEMALEQVAQPLVEVTEKRVVTRLREVLDEGVVAGIFRASLDTETVADLMYHLGKAIVLRALAGRGTIPLERILHVMDDLLGRGIQAQPGSRPDSVQ